LIFGLPWQRAGKVFLIVLALNVFVTWFADFIGVQVDMFLKFLISSCVAAFIIDDEQKVYKTECLKKSRSIK
jgi:hypothetical protein